MTKHSEAEMREACHLLAEHIMRLPAKRNSVNWLKQEMVDMLLGAGNIADLAADYADEYPYADVQNPYLVEALKAYDAE